MKADRRPDLIPDGCVGLAKAFSLFMQKLHPRWDPANPLRDAINAQTGVMDFKKAEDIENLFEEVEKQFRAALQSSELVAKIEVDGRRLATCADDWAGCNVRQGFWTNFVDGPDKRLIVQGPDTRTGPDKRYAPVFFERDAFDKWLVKVHPRRISRADEGRLPVRMQEFYKKNPGATRTAAKQWIEELLGCYIPREDWRKACGSVPAQGRPGTRSKKQ